MMAFLQNTYAAPPAAATADAGAAASAAASRDEAYQFTSEAIGPAHDGKRSAGVSIRVMPSSCFGSGGGSVAAAPKAPKAEGGKPSPPTEKKRGLAGGGATL